MSPKHPVAIHSRHLQFLHVPSKSAPANHKVWPGFAGSSGSSDGRFLHACLNDQCCNMHDHSNTETNLETLDATNVWWKVLRWFYRRCFRTLPTFQVHTFRRCIFSCSSQCARPSYETSYGAASRTTFANCFDTPVTRFLLLIPRPTGRGRERGKQVAACSDSH